MIHKDNYQRALHLPLWQKVVFVDWNGVLCREPFWNSILSNEQHPYYAKITEFSDQVFRRNKELVNSWMRGKVTSEQVLSSVQIELDRRAKRDYLLRRLLRDCSKMSCESEVVSALRSVSAESFIVLATDNMDCFASRMSLIPDLSKTVDAVLCSSDMGLLKADDVKRFFGDWLSHHGLTFSRALLLDDSAVTCQAFIQAGGHAVVVNRPDDVRNGISAWLSQLSH